jgi:hypothetical protein
MSDRLWLMHFKAMPMPTLRPRTLKQNAQEAQTPTEAPTTAITIAVITVITTAAITATTTAAITATITTIKKAKGRALSLEKWHKRLGHLNYADVK